MFPFVDLLTTTELSFDVTSVFVLSTYVLLVASVPAVGALLIVTLSAVTVGVVIPLLLIVVFPPFVVILSNPVKSFANSIFNVSVPSAFTAIFPDVVAPVAPPFTFNFSPNFLVTSVPLSPANVNGLLLIKSVFALFIAVFTVSPVTNLLFPGVTVPDVSTFKS